MNKGLVYLTTCLIITLTSINAWAVPFNSLYSFGDSLSDGGNSPSAALSVFKLLNNNCDSGHPCPPYVNGHYSNGPVAVEYLANYMLPGDATNTNFFNYAVAGATTGIGNFGDGGNAANPGLLGLPGMSQEIGLYLSNLRGLADPDALYFVWGGANDFLTRDSPNQAAQNIVGQITALALAGAEHFFVPNLPDLGLTPFATTEGLALPARMFSLGFNTELANQLEELDSRFPAADIIYFDTFSFLNNKIQNPAKYGFTDTQNACLSSLLMAPCINPDSHIFWDSVHPTTQAHAVFAAAFANTIPFENAVPEPGIILLFVAGLLALYITNSLRIE